MSGQASILNSQKVYVYNKVTGKVEETQIYKPDPSFPWKKEDANKPNDNKYEKMKLINYKNSHFNLIVGRDSALLSKINISNILEQSNDISKQLNKQTTILAEFK